MHTLEEIINAGFKRRTKLDLKIYKLQYIEAEEHNKDLISLYFAEEIAPSKDEVFPDEWDDHFPLILTVNRNTLEVNDSKILVTTFVNPEE